MNKPNESIPNAVKNVQRQIDLSDPGHSAIPVVHSKIPGTMVKNTRPATSITPGAVNAPIIVAIPPNAVTGVTISVYFSGPSQNQLVTVMNGANFYPFPSKDTMWWNCVQIPPTAAPQNISVTAVVDDSVQPNIPYLRVVNSPIPNGLNALGIDVSTYSDGAGNSVCVVIQDDAVTAP